ncbi:MAG TPA: response regulator transcription factor [Alphaproteobacteria bacterium]
MLRILIADHHELYREGLARLVTRLGETVAVVRAESLRAALGRLEAGPPFDLVLLNPDMPDAGGLAGVRAVKDAAPPTRVVVVSELETRALAERAMAAGAAGFVAKSEPASVMLHAFETVLAGGTYPPAALAPGAAGRERLALLTERQCHVLALIGEGMSNREIAAGLGISEGTVKVHVGAILKTLGVGNRTQAALLALEHAGLRRPAREDTNDGA